MRLQDERRKERRKAREERKDKVGLKGFLFHSSFWLPVLCLSQVANFIPCFCLLIKKEREQKKEELRRLKNLKRQEIQQKLQKLQGNLVFYTVLFTCNTSITIV